MKDIKVCTCHGKPIHTIRGTHLGEYINICSASGKECEVEKSKSITGGGRVGKSWVME